MPDEPPSKNNRRLGPRKATARYLENSALHYLQRFATSSANLRRVMMRKVERSARHHGTDAAKGAEVVEDLIRRYQRSGLLDDSAYAAARTRTLHRRGASIRDIRASLVKKGLGDEDIEAAVAGLTADIAEPDLVAAVRFARRRRLGPFGRAEEREDRHRRDLAALARAGFPYDTARRVVEAESAAALEAETASDIEV